MAQFNQSFTGGAVDLGALAQQAEARRELASGQFEPFIEVSEHDIEAKAFERSAQIPVVLMIGTARSGESTRLKETLTELAAGQRGFQVAYLDADAHPQMAQALGVRALPTVIALAAGRPVTNFEGDQPREQLSQWLEALVTNIGPQLEGLGDEAPAEEADAPEDPRWEQAEQEFAAGNFDAAVAVFDAMLADAPNDPQITQAKNTVTVLKRLDPNNRTTDPIAEAQADPDDVEKQLDAADAEVVAGDPEAAFSRLIPLVKAHPEAKARLLELFELFEPSDPRVIAARTQLASALF